MKYSEQGESFLVLSDFSINVEMLKKRILFYLRLAKLLFFVCKINYGMHLEDITS